MADVAIVWDPANGRGDIIMAGADLKGDPTLETAVLISLFTDRQAADDDVIPDGSGDPRGWWGDAYSDYPIGSKLWLRMRSKATAQVLQDVKDDCIEALSWMQDVGLAAAIDVETEWTQPTMLGVLITIHKPAGPPAKFAFQLAWQGV